MSQIQWLITFSSRYFSIIMSWSLCYCHGYCQPKLECERPELQQHYSGGTQAPTENNFSLLHPQVGNKLEDTLNNEIFGSQVCHDYDYSKEH